MNQTKRQIVIIHGGDPYRSYEEYLTELKAEELEPADFKRGRRWKDTLQEKLGANFEIFYPQMPMMENARYSDWKIYFEKLIPFLNDNAVFIGHSLGGIFLAKYFSENIFAKKIGAVMLVAAPYDTDDKNNTNESINDGMGGFSFQKSLKFLAQQVETIYLYHSKDDPAVDFADIEKFSAELPKAIRREFTDREHFRQKDFPELVRDIIDLQ